MIAPIPSAVSETGPRVRFSECSPVSRDSSIISDIGFFARTEPPIRLLLGAKSVPSLPRRYKLRCRRFRFPDAIPQEIHRHAKDHNDESRPGVLRFVSKKLNFDEDGHHQI